MTGRMAIVDDQATAERDGDTDSDIDDRLRATIEAIRPAVQADGGDIFFHGIDDRGVVTVELVGACVSCPASTLTLKAGIERILMDRVEGVTAVRDVSEDDETLLSL